MSAEAIAIVAVGVTLLAVLVPLMLALNHGVRSEVADLRREMQGELANVRSDMTDLRREMQGELANVRSDIADVRRDLQALGERVARIEGRLDALAPVMTPIRPMTAPAEPAPTPAA